MGNDCALEIIGIDFIKVKMDDDVICIISEVQHVKGLKKNLLGQLDDLGYEFLVKSGIMKVIKGVLVVIKVEKIVANLYMLHEKTYQEVRTFVGNFGEEFPLR